VAWNSVCIGRYAFYFWREKEKSVEYPPSLAVGSGLSVVEAQVGVMDAILPADVTTRDVAWRHKGVII
jgi:hypothetical protein